MLSVALTVFRTWLEVLHHQFIKEVLEVISKKRLYLKEESCLPGEALKFEVLFMDYIDY